MRVSKKLVFMLMLVGIMCSLVGCVKPYDTPEFVTIEASQTAFLIPLIGETSDQASFESEELLNSAKVATKEVQIPHRWVQTGRMNWAGEWRKSATLIIVERKPVTREWTSSKDSGSSAKNQAIYSESKESIGFSVGMNCSAQIDESNATKFLYRYNNKTLEDIMDTEIRAMVESEFNKACGKYAINDIINNKDEIMTNVNSSVTTFFAERGITITVLGMKEGISYEDSSIQQAINDKFSSEQKLVTQENNNKVAISKAEAEAQATILSAEAEAKANKVISESLSQLLIDKIKFEAWDGKLPTVQGSGSTIIDIRD